MAWASGSDEEAAVLLAFYLAGFFLMVWIFLSLKRPNGSSSSIIVFFRLYSSSCILSLVGFLFAEVVEGRLMVLDWLFTFCYCDCSFSAFAWLFLVVFYGKMLMNTFFCFGVLIAYGMAELGADDWMLFLLKCFVSVRLVWFCSSCDGCHPIDGPSCFCTPFVAVRLTSGLNSLNDSWFWSPWLAFGKYPKVFESLSCSKLLLSVYLEKRLRSLRADLKTWLSRAVFTLIFSTCF